MGGESERKFIFKTDKFEHINRTNNKKRAWRSLKQISTMERALIWPEDAVLYHSINAPPSFKPNRKYSDISGLIAPYTDPYSKLFYSNAEEYALIQKLPMDISAGYLQLRGASIII